MDPGSREASQLRIESIGFRCVLSGSVLLGIAFIWKSGFHYEGEFYFTLFDDAMISMTYARNLAEGAGLVWNPGEAPVEGYTNFLWVLWMALLHLLPVPEPKLGLAVMLSGLGILVGNLFVVRALLRRLAIRSLVFRVYAIAGIAFSYPLLFWTLRGMEVGLVALLFDLCLLMAVRHLEQAATRDLIGFAVLTGLGYLVRPDFLLPAGCIALVMLASRPAASWLACLTTLALIIGGTVIAQAIFRYETFGEWAPNTYYLKVSGHGLLERVDAGATAFWNELWRGLWIPVALAGIYLAGQEVLRRPFPRLLLALCGSQVLYSIYVGGDAWEVGIPHANRYLAAVLPALILLSAAGCEDLLEWTKRRVAGTLGASSAIWTAFAIAFCTLIAWAPMNQRHFWQWYREGAAYVAADSAMSQRGLLIRELTPPDTVIAVIWAGAIPYFSRRSAIDLLGKNDRRIARSEPRAKHFVPGHTKWDFEYSVGELRPDLIVNRWLLARGSERYFESLGYRRAPSEVGRYASSQLVREVELRLAARR